MLVLHARSGTMLIQITNKQPEAEPIETLFELNDTLYAKAHVPPAEDVYLWLGVSQNPQKLRCIEIIKADLQANVMLSYPIAEAFDLLADKLKGAKQKMADCEEDLDYLREQITVCIAVPKTVAYRTLLTVQTLEVATARVYNWDVGQRRKEKAEHGEDANDEGKEKVSPNG